MACTGSSPNWSSTPDSASLNSCISSATAGDTITVSAGSATWTTPSAGNPTVNINKRLIITGATTCTGSPVTCTDNTVITDGTGTGNGEQMLVVNADGTFLSGLTFQDTRSVTDFEAMMLFKCGDCRIHHNHFISNNPTHASRISYAYSVIGKAMCIDHNEFTNTNGGVDVISPSASDTTYNGDYSWAQPLTQGDLNQVYVEDNNFHSPFDNNLDGFVDNYAGARCVIRYNTIVNDGGGSHGLDSGPTDRSCLNQELYRNTFSYNGSGNRYTVYNTRGGTHMVFENTALATGTSYGSMMWFQSYRSSNGCTNCNGWGDCDGTNLIDQNTGGGQGYACRDQVGRGPTTDAANDWPVDTVSPTYAQVLMPAYNWKNTFKGALPTSSDYAITGYDDNVRAQNFHLFYNRDIYIENASFNGTSGTGYGTLASRPGTCTVGVAYWATDQGSWNISGNGDGSGVLYKCTSTNVWTASYTPGQYPHPLQGTTPPVISPSPPTSVARGRSLRYFI